MGMFLNVIAALDLPERFMPADSGSRQSLFFASH